MARRTARTMIRKTQSEGIDEEPLTSMRTKSRTESSGLNICSRVLACGACDILPE